MEDFVPRGRVSDVHAPLRSKRVRGSKSPWITTELKKMMHLRDRLKIKAIRSGDAIDWNNFKRARNNVNNAIDLIHDGRHVGFAIIMQISYSLLRGQTT